MNGKVGIKNVGSPAYVRNATKREELLTHYFQTWKRHEPLDTTQASSSESWPELPPCIALSRKNGVGALEVADIAARKLGYAVADRSLIEQIATQADISEKAIAFFDERFPGYANRTFKYLFGEKAFIDSDYSRHLVRAVLALAASEPTVFVGRGAHLILPRESVLAVRCIRSENHRVKRMAETFNIDKSTALKKLNTMDKEQSAFFRKVFGRKDATAYEFDLVLNLDHITDYEDAADIVVLAFNRKYKATDKSTGERISA